MGRPWYREEVIGRNSLSMPWPSGLRGAAGLGAVAAKMLDGDGMVPGNLAGQYSESAGKAQSLCWAGGEVPGDDGLHQFGIESGSRDQLVHAHPGLFQIAGDGPHNHAMLSLSRALVTIY